MSNKTGYIAVPLEEPAQDKQLPVYSKEFQQNSVPHVLVGATPRGCCHQDCQRKRIWRRVLIFTLLFFLGGRFLFTGLSYFMFNELNNVNHDHQHTNLGTPLFISKFDMPVPPVPHIPKEPLCDPVYKWTGPPEILIDPRSISGLLFSIKGLISVMNLSESVSEHGSVTIRQDPFLKDFINVTNMIYLSDESLQKEVDIKLDLIDDDYSITIETPSFESPRRSQKCVFIDTIITLPGQIHTFRSILIDVPNSHILAEGLGNVDFAYVGLKTKSGHIKADDVNFAIGEISTVNGHVKGSYIVSENLEVRTINGAITINAIANAWSEDISVSAKSINGHLNINVEDLTENQDLTFKAGTVNGGVVVTVPDSYAGNFSAATLVGHSYVEGKDLTYYKNTRNVK
ncbi:16181_t:CDS:2, partial [Cetraspora pellucida]